MAGSAMRSAAGPIAAIFPRFKTTPMSAIFRAPIAFCSTSKTVTLEELTTSRIV